MSYKIYMTLLNAQFLASALTPLCILNNTRELLLVTASLSHTHTQEIVSNLHTRKMTTAYEKCVFSEMLVLKWMHGRLNCALAKMVKEN